MAYENGRYMSTNRMLIHRQSYENLSIDLDGKEDRCVYVIKKQTY